MLDLCTCYMSNFRTKECLVDGFNCSKCLLIAYICMLIICQIPVSLCDHLRTHRVQYIHCCHDWWLTTNVLYMQDTLISECIETKVILLALGTSTCMTSSDTYGVPISVNSEIYKFKISAYIGMSGARWIEGERTKIRRAANINMLGNMRQIGNMLWGTVYNSKWSM